MKALKIITKILAVILISLVAFFGVYVQKQNRMENQVKDFTFGMDLDGARVVKLKVSDEKETITKDKEGKIVKDEEKKEDGEYTTEEKPYNPDEVKTTDNYNKSKEIIEKRLGQLGINQYVIRLDEESGNMVIEIPENDETDHIVSNISEVGKFEIVDSENTDKVLMDNSDIKNARVMYNTDTKGTTVLLSIEFNKTGAEKLKNISIEYATVDKEETNKTEESSQEETSNNEQESKQKEIIMQVDNNKMITTSFSETMENGKIPLTMGQATTDKEKIQEYIESATTIATVLDTGNLPIKYEIEENEYVATDITKDMLTKLVITVAAVVLIALLVLAIRYRVLGILAAFGFIGFTSIFVLLLRYTNVIITLEGLAAIGVILVLNYVYNYKLLEKFKKSEKNLVMKNTFIEFCIKAIPICILSVVFCFISWNPISSFGMTMFWGLVLMAIYNLIVTRSFLR